MKIGLTYDLREDYGIQADSDVFADFCNPGEIEYLASAIRANGYDVEMIGNMYRLNRHIIEGTFDCDLVFVADEGISSRNREAIVPALLELNHIPYVGSDAYAMGLTQNKSHTKLVAASLGIRVPKEIYLPFGQAAPENYLRDRMRAESMEYPVIIKPNAEGYSMGVFLARTPKEAIHGILYNFENYRQEVLIEQYIHGPELYVPLVGTGRSAYVLGVGVCRYSDGSDIDVFSLKDKCFTPVVDEVANLPEPVSRCLCEWSLSLYRHLGCLDFGRTDFKLDQDGTAYFLEINPRPGLTERGPYETCGAGAGKSYTELIGEIIDSALERYQPGR